MENVNDKAKILKLDEVKISPEITSTALDLNDLIFISENSFGLRNVPTKEQAKKEMSEGLHGDAVAISSIKNLAKHLGLSKNLSLNTNKENQFLVDAFSSSIKDFLSFSIGDYINHLPKDHRKTVGLTAEMLMKNGGAFLIGDFQGGNIGGEDYAYYNLGKCGKQKLKPKSIKGMIEINEDDISILKNSFSSKMDQEGFDLIRTIMSDVLFRKFVDFIHAQEKLS